MTWQVTERTARWIFLAVGGGLAFGEWQGSLDAGFWMAFVFLAIWRLVEGMRHR